MAIAGWQAVQERLSRAVVALGVVMTSCTQFRVDSRDEDGGVVVPPDNDDPDDGAPADSAPPDSAPPGSVVTIDDFEDGNDDGWTRHGGTFSTAGGVYRLSNVDSYGKSSWITPPDDVTIDLDVRFEEGDGDAGAIFRATDLGDGSDEMNGYYGAVNVSGDIAFFGRMDGGYTALGSAPVSIDPETWYHLKVIAIGSELRLYVGDMAVPKVVVFDDEWTSGAVGVRTFYSSAWFDNVTTTE